MENIRDDSTFQVELEFGVLVFVEGVNPENPERSPRSKDENQQQIQPTCDTRSGIGPGTQWWEEIKHSHHCTIPAPTIPAALKCRKSIQQNRKERALVDIVMALYTMAQER